MKSNYISPSTRVIRVSLNGMLMQSPGSVQNINPQDTESYDVTNDSDNWF